MIKRLEDLLARCSGLNPTTGCIEWSGGYSGSGYGACVFRGRQTGVHRVSYELVHGPIPPGLCVLHRCDNRKCIAPAHLFLGTRADNAKDRDAKKRAPYGSRHPAAKLSIGDVRAIREAKASATQKAIAARFDVSESLVSQIHRGRIWVEA